MADLNEFNECILREQKALSSMIQHLYCACGDHAAESLHMYKWAPPGLIIVQGTFCSCHLLPVLDPTGSEGKWNRRGCNSNFWILEVSSLSWTL